MASADNLTTYKRPWFGILGSVTWNLTLGLYELPTLGRRRWWWQLHYHLWREFRKIRPNDMARRAQGPSPESLAFGETPLSSLQRILSAAGLKPGQRLVDIGCGRGNLVIGAACLGYRAVGLEYFAEYVERTSRVVAALGCSDVELVPGDFLRGPLPDGDLYFLAATAFGDRTREQLLPLLEAVRPGALVVALDWVVESSKLELTKQFFIPVGWGVAAVCIHSRKEPPSVLEE